MSIGAIPVTAPIAAPPQPSGNPGQLPIAAPMPRQPTGVELEVLARHKLLRMLGLNIEVTAPHWNQILFSSTKIRLRIESPPQSCIDAIDQTPPEALPGDAVATEANVLLKGLAASKPRGVPPKSIVGSKPLPPPKDAEAKWLRSVWLITVGPDATRLLVAAGYLTPSDLTALDTAYPKGLDAEKQAAVGAAMALTTASARTGVEHDLPPWLNDQLLTLLDESRPTRYYADIYAAEQAQAKPAAGPNPSSASPNLISRQSAPSVAQGDTK